jgi:hypothetical protein
MPSACGLAFLFLLKLEIELLFLVFFKCLFECRSIFNDLVFADWRTSTWL